MVIKCTLSVPLESIKNYARQLSELPPLPDYINRKGPYMNIREGGNHQIIIIYKIDKSKFGEARENISKQLRSLDGLPEFTLSAHTYGPRPCHLILEKGQEVKHDQIG
jgi:hypothetical protein